MKFGGTSVGSAERIRALAERVRERLARRPVVVVSAFSKVTDLLVRGANLALARDSDYENVIFEVLERHHGAINELVPRGPAQDRLLAHVDSTITRAARALHRRLSPGRADRAHPGRHLRHRRAPLLRDRGRGPRRRGHRRPGRRRARGDRHRRELRPRRAPHGGDAGGGGAHGQARWSTTARSPSCPASSAAPARASPPRSAAGAATGRRRSWARRWTRRRSRSGRTWTA